MAVVIAALLPVFLLIVLGFVLKRTLMRLETQWHGLERLTFYVLFPVLLVQTLVKADLTKVPVAGVGGALLLAVLSMSLLCLALRPVLARAAVDGPAFTSIFQGATRWQTYVALAVSGNLFGDLGLAVASVAMVAIIPLANVFSVGVLARYASAEKRSPGAIVMTVVRNPLIWACAIGLALNVTHIPLPKLWHEVADALGRSSLAIGLLVTGAGLHLEGMFRPSLAASLAVFLKLVLMPMIAVALALLFGLTGSNLAIVTVCSAVPTSSSAYVMARQMNGDAPLLAQIITLQTILAAVTMPIAIAWRSVNAPPKWTLAAELRGRRRKMQFIRDSRISAHTENNRSSFSRSVQGRGDPDDVYRLLLEHCNIDCISLFQHAHPSWWCSDQRHERHPAAWRSRRCCYGSPNRNSSLIFETTSEIFRISSCVEFTYDNSSQYN